MPIFTYHVAYRKQKLFVEPETIHNLFVRHNLALKKTPHSI